jgi:Cytochrome P450
MFSTVHHTPHSVKKRTMANIYSKSYLQSSEQVKANSVALLRDRFLPMLQHYAETGTEVDMHDLNNAFTMDFMSAYQYGLANSTNFLRDVESRRRVLSEYHSRRDYEVYSAEVPRLKNWSRVLGKWRLVPEFVDNANTYLEQWNKKMGEGANSYLGQVENPGDEPVVYKQFTLGFGKLAQKEFLTEKPSPAEADLNARTVYSEMLDHLGAGHETSAVALTYLYLEMSRRPQLQTQLRSEVMTLQPNITWPPKSGKAFTLPDTKQIDGLPLLHAIIMETLRLHAPIPGMEPRVTPASGCTIGGVANIPGNVRVSAMPYCLHRNPTVFPDPEAWKPERWLIDAQSERYKEMMRWFWAFGSGGRMCIGSNLAIQEIKLVVSAVYTNFRTIVADGGDVDVQEMDAYTTRPTSNRLGLRFVKV